MQRIYLDYAASTPLDPRVLEAMEPYFGQKFGNPSSLHSFGQEALGAVDRARETITRILGAAFREFVFTSSATEANNLALRGAVKRVRRQASSVTHPRIIVSAVEHESVLETAEDLAHEGVEVIYLPVHKDGAVNLRELGSALNEQTVLVSVMYVNNEVGTVQPIPEIARIIRDFRKKLEMRNEKLGDGSSSLISHLSYPLFHTDAAQAFSFFECNAAELGVDMMTLSGHKIYGPKGVGGLYVSRKLEMRNEKLGFKRSRSSSLISYLSPLLTGGGQEFGFRSGTENVPLIVGFVKAAELAVASREEEVHRLGALKLRFWEKLKAMEPSLEVNGPLDAGQASPHILNVYFPGRPAETLLTQFDLHGLATSSGSACVSRAAKPSFVLQAMGHSRERASQSIRVSFGRQTTEEEADQALAVIKKSLTIKAILRME